MGIFSKNTHCSKRQDPGETQEGPGLRKIQSGRAFGIMAAVGLGRVPSPRQSKSVGLTLVFSIHVAQGPFSAALTSDTLNPPPCLLIIAFLCLGLLSPRSGRLFLIWTHSRGIIFPST